MRKAKQKRHIRWSAVMLVICVITATIELNATHTLSGKTMLPCSILILMLIISSGKRKKHAKRAKPTIKPEYNIYRKVS